METTGITLCFQGPNYRVLEGSRALTIRSLEAWGNVTSVVTVTVVSIATEAGNSFLGYCQHEFSGF